MRIFITGATGVVGRRVVPTLIGAGPEVTAVGRTAEKREWLERQGARAVKADAVPRPTSRSPLSSSGVVPAEVLPPVRTGACGPG